MTIFQRRSKRRECVSQSEGERKGATQATAAIPDKLYFRIGEVAKLLGVAPYVLRFWESEFPHMKPNKGGTGQRLYRRRDVEAAFRIRQLLYDEGYTIPGARQALKTDGKAGAPKLPLLAKSSAEEAVNAAPLRRMRAELREIAAILARPSPLLGRQAQRSATAPHAGAEAGETATQPVLFAKEQEAGLETFPREENDNNEAD